MRLDYHLGGTDQRNLLMERLNKSVTGAVNVLRASPRSTNFLCSLMFSNVRTAGVWKASSRIHLRGKSLLQNRMPSSWIWAPVQRGAELSPISKLGPALPDSVHTLPHCPNLDGERGGPIVVLLEA